VFSGLQEEYKAEIEAVGQQFPVEPFVFLDPPLRLNFKQGIDLLAEAGVHLDDQDDLSTPDEKLLGRLVRKKVRIYFEWKQFLILIFILVFSTTPTSTSWTSSRWPSVRSTPCRTQTIRLQQ